jgi:hypothetical protein
MKWLWTMVPVVSLFLAMPCLAENKDSKMGIGISPGELAPTQEMWFYEQYQKQYADPKATVRQKAEFRAEERMRRMTALRWFGFSNQRPSAGVDVVHSELAPQWAASNVNLPFRWSGPTTTTIVVKPATPSGRTY